MLFGVPLLDLLAYMYEDNVSSARPWETTSFRTLDATDYSSIGEDFHLFIRILFILLLLLLLLCDYFSISEDN